MLPFSAVKESERPFYKKVISLTSAATAAIITIAVYTLDSFFIPIADYAAGSLPKTLLVAVGFFVCLVFASVITSGIVVGLLRTARRS